MDNIFVPPPEAPVFEPTPEQFRDPITYIDEIRPHAEKFGLCKIKPPPTWQPPFDINAESFRFIPRIQRLSELEAKSRLRHYFLNDLAKFWELQNNSLKRHIIENKTVDLYHLRKFVHEKEGYHKVNKYGLWKEISSMLGFTASNEVASYLQKVYEKTLLPYDMVVSNASLDEGQKIIDADNSENNKQKTEIKTEEKKSNIKPPVSCEDDNNTDVPSCSQILVTNSELKKLQFYGPGPKMAVVDLNGLVSTSPKKTRSRKSGSMFKKTCDVCGGPEGELGSLASCSTCSAHYHHGCSIIAPKDGSKKPWRCHNCLAKECKRPMPSYGFEESKVEYTLKSFGEMADKFKSDHFEATCRSVSCSEVEKEFWHLVDSLDRDVVVEYGADIHTLTAGSGFPTERSRHLISEEDQEYISSPWNLNNLPILPGSLLRYINMDINGMKIPWVYVGMCFSSFAWHIEDHWNYSINYLHWGEPKTWYSVPGDSAELLEERMKENAPELFQEFPDLLHHITTIMNPNTLTKSGVPIFRTDQHAGEFVVTFPRSYHSGFNQGYNFAEAVNFCTPDWLPFGRGCIENYRLLRRQCVFSNDEFLCRIASEAEDLTDDCISRLLDVFRAVVEAERGVRTRVKEKGITTVVRKEFELLSDDERQCERCLTTCYLSAVTCTCSSAKMVCSCHVEELCPCPSSAKTFLFRHSMEELVAMEEKLSRRLVGFEGWCEKAQRALEAKGRSKLKLETMKAILDEAVVRKYPSNALVESFKDFVKKANRYFYIIKVIDSEREIDEMEKRPTFEELLRMLDDVDNLPCRVPFKAKLSEHVVAIQDFCDEIRSEVARDPPDGDRIELLFEKGGKFNIDITDVALLHRAMSKLSWLQEVGEIESETLQISWETVQRLYETGQEFSKCSTSDQKLDYLRRLIDGCQRLENLVALNLNQKPPRELRDLEQLLEECLNSKVVIPSMGILEAAIKDSNEWLQQTLELFRDHIDLDCEYGHRTSLEEAESHLNKGLQLPVQLAETSIISAKVCCAKSWINKLADLMLKSKQDSLIEVLTPRTDLSFLLGKDAPSKAVMLDRNLKNIDLNQERDLELSEMRQLRTLNTQKNKGNFCTCLKGKFGRMIQCHLCCDLFHVGCVSYDEPSRTEETTEERYDGFMCPRCSRTKRAPFHVLQVYVDQYENDLDLRLLEADVLKDIVRRAEIWRENVEKVFKNLQISGLLQSWKRGELSKDYTNISSSALEALDYFLTSGNIIEVFLPEKNFIRGVLSDFKPSYKSVILEFPSALPDLLDMCQKRPSSGCNKGKRSIDGCLRNDDDPPKKVKKINETSPSASKMSKSLNSSESDERCSAEPCQDPQGDSLEWVQCDFCKKWFHFECIGLQKIKKKEKFQCSHCSAKLPPVGSPLMLPILSNFIKKAPARRSADRSTTREQPPRKLSISMLPLKTLIRLNALNGCKKAISLPTPRVIVPGLKTGMSLPTVVVPNKKAATPPLLLKMQEGIHIIDADEDKETATVEATSSTTTPIIQIAPIASSPVHPSSNLASQNGISASDDVIVIEDDDD